MGEGRWGDMLGLGFSDGLFLCVMMCELSEISGILLEIIELL